MLRSARLLHLHRRCVDDRSLAIELLRQILQMALVRRVVPPLAARRCEQQVKEHENRPKAIGENLGVPPLEYFTHAPQPPANTLIWRYRPLKYFRDIIQTREFHFTRADRLPQDEDEGIPPEEYIAAVRGLDRFALDLQSTIDNDIGVLAQDREAFFIHCWYLFDDERASVWKDYAFDPDEQEHGVAICSRYDLLCRAATGFEPRPHVGVVNTAPGTSTATTTSSSSSPRSESSSRAIASCRLRLWHLHPLAGNNRHGRANGP